MTLTEARRILGLGPDEDPRPHLVEFRAARERIAELVRTAPNPVLADRYQQGLVEFDQALAAVREYLEALGLVAVPVETMADAPPEPDSDEVETKEEETVRKRGRAAAVFVLLMVCLTGAAAGGWLYYRHEDDKVLQRQARIALLERIGSEYVENRRWQEAAAAFTEIERLMPGSELAVLGRRSIEAGMNEEQTQFVGYWTGQAIAELEAGRFDESKSAARRVLERFPGEKEVAAILVKIDEARVIQTRDAAITATRRMVDERRWDEAIAAAQQLLANAPENHEAEAILAEASAARAKFNADQSRAAELLELAAARDHGQFDQQALDWLREAAALAPEQAEIAAMLEKMASYTRTLRVPGDFDTPAEALAAARDRDRIVLAESTWRGPLVINATIELQGAGNAKTIVECSATEGSAITIGPDARGARITGIAFRHESFHAEGGDRFSAALVRGGGVTFTDCRFSDASGHGLAVIENGETLATRCRFSDNGWNGAAAIGKGCVLEIRDSEARDNFENGIESWDGASVTLVNNRCLGNSRNGIHADNGPAAAIIEGNQLADNREFGLLLGSAASGRVTGNTARGNLLGGIVVRKAASALSLTGNQSTLNQGPGLVLEKGLPPASYASNKVEKNTGRDLFLDAELAQDP